MSLFQKKILPITVPKYTAGHQETLLIIGLGNVGKKYDITRHNIGFEFVDRFAREEAFNPWVEKKDLKSMLCAKIIDGKKVILCKPTTYMNLSGEAVRAVCQFYKLTSLNVCVVYDELDIEFGTLRAQKSASSAGHNGIKSLLDHNESSFWRIRIGIGPKVPAQMDTADFVLQKFSTEQQGLLPAIHKEATSLVQEWLAGSATPDTRKIA